MYFGHKGPFFIKKNVKKERGANYLNFLGGRDEGYSLTWVQNFFPFSQGKFVPNFRGGVFRRFFNPSGGTLSGRGGRLQIFSGKGGIG